jgi:hypothetical protein
MTYMMLGLTDCSTGKGLVILPVRLFMQRHGDGTFAAILSRLCCSRCKGFGACGHWVIACHTVSVLPRGYVVWGTIPANRYYERFAEFWHDQGILT